MTTLSAFDRFTCLILEGFDGWQLPVDDAAAARLLADQRNGTPRWPFYAAAFSELSGGLADLPDDAADGALLELMHHGLTLARAGVVTCEDVRLARNAVYEDFCAAMREGAKIDAAIREQVAKNN